MVAHRAGDSDARGKAAAAALLAGPAYSLMKWTITFTVFITRNPNGFTATCPAFPHHTVTGPNRRAAYKTIKESIRKELCRNLDQELPSPKDPVVSVKHLRVNMLEIHREVGLG